MKNYQSIFFTLLILSLIGCATGNKFGRQHNPRSIPSDLRENGHVLLVMRYQGGMMSGRDNRAIQRFMTENYGAPFEIVTREELKSPAYADTDKYKYVIIDAGTAVTVTETTMRPGIGTSRSISRSYDDMVIINRKEDKRLPVMGVPVPSYAAGIKMFSEYLKKKS